MILFVGQTLAQTPEQDLIKGNYQSAISGFNQALQTNPTDLHAQTGLLKAYLETGKYSELESAAKNFLSKGANPRIHFYLGEVYAETGRYQDAIAEFEAAGKTQGANKLQADLRRGELLEIVGQKDQAEAIYQSIISYYVNNGSASPAELTPVAKALVHLEKPHDANDVYLKAIGVNAGDIDAQLGDGELWTSAYQYGDAAVFYADALKVNPNSARAYLGIAANKRINGGDEMEKALAKALEINPNYVEALTFKASYDLDSGDFDLAAKDIDQALKINPNSLDGHSVLAALYYLRDKQSDSETEIKKTLAINPRYGQLFNTLSHFATNNRKYNEGVDYSKRALALDPKLWQAHLDLGIGLLRTGHETEGRSEIEIAFKGDPFNIWAKNMLDMLDVVRGYKEIKHNQFIIKAAADESEPVSYYASNLLDEVYQKLTTKYHFTPQGPITVYVFQNHDDFAVATLGLPGLGALGVCFGQVVAIDSPKARPSGEFNWGTTLWHEFTHVITLQTTDYRIPRWLSEGLSVYEERRARPGWGDDWSEHNLKAFSDGRWLKIADIDDGFLRPKSPDQVSLSYFQASQICEFITDKYGFDAILQILDGYKRKQKTPEILKQVLKLSQEDFDKSFNEYIHSKVDSYLRALSFSWQNGNRGELPKETIEALFKQHQDDFALNLQMATIYRQSGDKQKAIDTFKHSITLFPYYVGPGNAYEQLAEMYEAAGDKAAAADQLEALVKIDENNIKAVNHLTQLRFALGDKTRGLEALKLSFYIWPLDAAPHAEIANYYLNNGNATGAVDEFHLALGLKPANLSEAQYNYARALLADGKPTEAKRAVLQALETAPGYEKAQELLLKLTGNK
ncbi:MAG TPA: tetratricopeptide repeat protein [Blastocatellia bacterium]|nr:tetratricopeptide repeat protein [Blastocatellia bacterium]